MGDPTSGSGPEEKDTSLYESIRSRPVTPAVILTVNTSGSRGGSRSGQTTCSSTSDAAESFQIHAHSSKLNSTSQVVVDGESYGLKILGCNAPRIDDRPLSAVSRLGPIKEEVVNEFQTTTDEHGHVMELSDGFQKLKITRCQQEPSCDGGEDGPIAVYSEDMNISPPNGITIQSLTSNAIVVVPETHRSNQDQPVSSLDEIQVYPSSSEKCKLSKRRRKRRVKYPNTGNNDRRPLTGFHNSLPDDVHGHGHGHVGYPVINGHDHDETEGGESDACYSSMPSTARSTFFDEFEMMRPETASSEILGDGTLVSEEEQQLKNLKTMFGIQDEDDWYSNAEETGHSRKHKLRQLTKLFYRRYAKQSTQGTLYTHKLMLVGLHNRLEDFVLLTVPPGFNLKMRITRVKKGVAGKFYPLYYMHLERDTPGDRKCLILVAKKHRVFGGTGYTLSTDPAELTTQSEYCVGKIDSNFIGTEFTLYGGRSICSHIPLDKGALMALPKIERFKEELATVLYDPNVLGFKGPRKMKVVIPKMKNLLEREVICPRIAEESLLQRYQAEDVQPIWCLKNKDPIWNRETHSYILNFAGRVNSASVKNFQIVCEDNEEHVLLQFGRASENTFSLDFQYPFSPLQAFAIALTSFDSKLACE